MKNRFVIALMSLFPFSGLAFGAASPIEEVDLGSCWIQDNSATQGVPFFKIASFSIATPVTLQLYSDSATGPSTIGKTVKEAVLGALPASKGTVRYSVAIHCSASQVQPMISATLDGAKFCLHGSFGSGDNALKIERVLPDPFTGPNDGCRGVNPGVLLFGLKDKTTAAAAEAALLKRQGGLIEKIERLDAIGVLILHLKKAEFYREADAKARIEKDARLAAYRHSIAYDEVTLTVGTPVELWKDSIALP